MNKSHRGSVKLEDCEIIAHKKYEADQFVLTLASDYISNHTKPGQFVHATVSEKLLMRRPISIMSVNSKENTFDLLYKVVGDGTRELSKRKVGEQISVMGPIGNGFNFDSVKRPIMIGGGVGIPPMVALAQQLNLKTQKPLAIFGSEVEFPFEMEITDKSYPFIEKPATMSLLHEWGIDCLLTSNSDFQGVYKGYVTDLAREYLKTLSVEELREVKIFACGPDMMLKAVKTLASQLNVECELSLEEFMACAIGGCAGCVVEVETEAGKSMKRVCVDGPIFDANSIFQ